MQYSPLFPISARKISQKMKRYTTFHRFKKNVFRLKHNLSAFGEMFPFDFYDFILQISHTLQQHNYVKDLFVFVNKIKHFQFRIFRARVAAIFNFSINLAIWINNKPEHIQRNRTFLFQFFLSNVSVLLFLVLPKQLYIINDMYDILIFTKKYSP